MALRVGPKGQVVIEKEIRDQLGVVPGSLAVQQLVGDHVEIRFLPAVHNRSLLGVLAPLTSVRIPAQQWRAVRERAADISTRAAWDEETDHAGEPGAAGEPSEAGA